MKNKDHKWIHTTINGYEIEHESDDNGADDNGDRMRFSCGTISKGEFNASLGRFMQGEPLEDGYGEELEIPDGTRTRIEKWVYAQGW
tara:strand:- start:373 stop:633 length:261 start_codon:yes stop_codon:yes gene_type:complete